MTGIGRQTLLAGCCLFAALAWTCAEFTETNEGAPSNDGGGTGADSGSSSTDGGEAGGSRWCDGGHTFCADFDDLALSDPPNKGWTEAFRDSVGSTSSLVQPEALSAPNAARMDLPNVAKTFFVFSHTTEAGAPIREATLRFAIRTKVGEVPDGGNPEYNVGRLRLRNASGNEVGHIDIEWRLTVIDGIGWSGGTGWPGGVWKREAGALSFDEWLVVTLVANIPNHEFRIKLQDTAGVTLGEMHRDDPNIDDWIDIRSVTIEIGASGSDDVRPALALTFDNVALDIAH